MKLLIDIGHPAHVHYFRRFIQKMEERGHEIYVTARDKEVALQLLTEYGIAHLNRGKGKNGMLGKLWYMFQADFKLLRTTRRFKADAYLSFASPYAAQVAWLRRKPHIAFDDTEHAGFARKFYLPFTRLVYTPFCFEKDLGAKHQRFDSFMELAYLHPNFSFNLLHHKQVALPKKPYAIVRFVSWNASHDIGQSGLSLEAKRIIIEQISERYEVLLSAEGNCPEEFKPYLVSFSPSEVHHYLKGAELFIGEGATMAVESAFLGTPAIYVNSLNAGTLKEVEKMGLMFSFRQFEGVQLCLDNVLKSRLKHTAEFKYKHAKLKQFSDPTDLLLQLFDEQEVWKR